MDYEGENNKEKVILMNYQKTKNFCNIVQVAGRKKLKHEANKLKYLEMVMIHKANIQKSPKKELKQGEIGNEQTKINKKKSKKEKEMKKIRYEIKHIKE